MAVLSWVLNLDFAAGFIVPPADVGVTLHVDQSEITTREIEQSQDNTLFITGIRQTFPATI